MLIAYFGCEYTQFIVLEYILMPALFEYWKKWMNTKQLFSKNKYY